MSEESPQYQATERAGLAACAGSGNPAAAARHDGETLSRDADISPLTPYYQDALCTIYHGDCMDILPTLERADLVLTDPPYGLSTGKTKCGGSKSLKWDEQQWDRQTCQPAVDLAISAGDVVILWGGNYYDLPPSRCWLAWDKCQPDAWYSTAHFELAWTNMDRNARRWRMSQVEAYGAMDKKHPSQKPERLMQWCINLVPAARTILDPFMGSGTTLRAAKDSGRVAIGIEREEKYCEIAAKRLAQEVLNFAGGDADFGVTDSNLSSQAELLDSPNAVLSDRP